MEDCFPGAIESIKGKAVSDGEAATSEQEAAWFLFNVGQETEDVSITYQLSAEGSEEEYMRFKIQMLSLSTMAAFKCPMGLRSLNSLRSTNGLH